MVLAINLLGDWLRDALNPKLADDARRSLQCLMQGGVRCAYCFRCSRGSGRRAAVPPGARPGARCPGHRYRKTIENRYPGIINMVGDQGATRAHTGNRSRSRRAPARSSWSSCSPHGHFGGSTKTMRLTLEPCKRYYLNAQFADWVIPEWEPVVDYVESIGGCNNRPPRLSRDCVGAAALRSGRADEHRSAAARGRAPSRRISRRAAARWSRSTTFRSRSRRARSSESSANRAPASR